ncbi:hypothetical protein FIBSPDRAFT_962287 [Athelia psychrophila]|uniref:Glycopeptide n=1 Tax=Athelia psychrophila TaxID=1759441 RepID=A0A166AAS5_9AGAM|nr:hypothetical protein FIBSPDRAFT_962287 [Fibularhizoctonia sp. CBS 109695]
MFSPAVAIATFAALVGIVSAQHSVSITNNCGTGTPYMNGPSTGLIAIPNGYSTAGDMTGWIIFLQTGACGAQGEGCLIVEGTLNGGYSDVDISRIPPNTFNVAASFSYTDGDGGKSCATADCACDSDAYCTSGQSGAIASSPDPAASIEITFC